MKSRDFSGWLSDEDSTLYKKKKKDSTLPMQGPQVHFPSQGTRSQMLQLRVCMLQLKIPHFTIQVDLT